MKPPDAARLLEAWEWGQSRNLQARAFGFLQLARPDVDAEELTHFSIGARDAALLDLRAWLFGDTLEVTTRCEVCGERLEASLEIAPLRVGSAASPLAEHVLEIDGVSMHFRVPQVGDLLSLKSPYDEADIKRNILQACVLEALNESREALSAERIPGLAIEALAKRMGELDPQADMELGFTCPHCHTEFSRIFDIASVLVKEVNNWAQRVLRDIHTLATAYGWSEAQILALGPARRQAYLDMVRP